MVSLFGHLYLDGAWLGVRVGISDGVMDQGLYDDYDMIHLFYSVVCIL